MIAIKIKKIIPEAIMPKKSTDGAAAFDVKIPLTTRVKYGRNLISTGLAFEMPRFLRLDCRARSNNSAHGLIVTDESGNKIRIDADVTLGLIDYDYRGEVGVIFHVRDWRVRWKFWKRYYVTEGQALAKLCFTKVPDIILFESGTIEETLRGAKGFGEADGEGKKQIK